MASVVGTVGSALVISKVAATVGGPPTVGSLAAVVGLVSGFIAVANFGIPTAIPAATPSGLSTVELRSTVRNSLIAVIIGIPFGLAAIFMVAVISNDSSEIESWDSTVLVAFAGVAGVGILVSTALASVILGPSWAAACALLANLAAATLTSLALILGWSAPSAVGLGGCGSGVVSVCFIALVLRNHRLKRTTTESGSRGRVAGFLEFLRLSVRLWTASVAANVSFAAIPVAVISMFGEYDAGIFRAPFAVSMLYLSAGLTLVSVQLYPSLAQAPSDVLHARRLMRRMRLKLVMVFGGASCIVIPFSPLLITLLFSPEFIAGSELLPPLILFAVTRVLTWSNLVYLAARREFGLIAAIEWLFAALVPLGFAFSIYLSLPFNVLAWVLWATSLVPLMLAEFILRRKRMPSILLA